MSGYTTRAGMATTYTYNNGSRSVTSWASGRQNDNLNAFNQVTTITASGANGYTFTYDSDGNRLTQALQPPGSPLPPVQNSSYTWNDDDRLSKVTLPSTANDTFGYDANGIRVSKGDSSGNVNYLIYSQTQSILATYDAVAGTRLVTYNQNPKKIDEIVSYQTGAAKYYPHADMLGSVYAEAIRPGRRSRPGRMMSGARGRRRVAR